MEIAVETKMCFIKVHERKLTKQHFKDMEHNFCIRESFSRRDGTKDAAGLDKIVAKFLTAIAESLSSESQQFFTW